MQKKILFLILTVALFAIPAFAQTKQPKTVRDFFNLLPREYFEIGCCVEYGETHTKEGRAKYLERFLEVDDPANGYLEGRGHAGQGGIKMALFKRPDGSYLAGVETHTVLTMDNYFLEYRNGKWFDVSSKVVPQFGKNKFYSLPRYGTKIEVFAKKAIEKISDEQIIYETGAKLYDLVWNGEKFTIKE